MTPEQMSHHTEQIDRINDDHVSITIDTDTLDVKEQVEMTKKLILEHLGLEVYA